jgi:hypothetical protein
MLESSLDRLYAFFGDAAIAAMVSFLVAKLLPSRPGQLVKTLVQAISDGKISSDEIARLRAALYPDR